MENAYSPVHGELSTRTEHQTNFESMLKLLLFMETELRFKEELLELLLEDDRVQSILNEKLTELGKHQASDPSLALGRDGLYDEEAWDECFREWRGSNPPVEHVICANSQHLGATVAMRCIEVAKLQLNKYTETYFTLQKAAKSYKKLKQKIVKERHRRSQGDNSDGPENASDVIAKLQENNKLLYEKLEWERNRADKLENQMEVMNAMMCRDRRKSGYIVKVLVEEVEQLSQQLKLHDKLSRVHANGFHVNHQKIK